MTAEDGHVDRPADLRTPISVAKTIAQQLRPALVGLISLTILTGCLFPLALFAIAQPAFPDQAGASLASRNGVIVGSRLIGQIFTRRDYFQPRSSAAGSGYDGTSSGGTNYGPSNAKLIEAIRKSARDYRARNGLPPDAPIPVDAVTSSGSGLDPQISPENAALQVPRVASARGLDQIAVRRLVAQHTQGRQFGFMGSPRVSVLELNLALDQAARTGPG